MNAWPPKELQPITARMSEWSAWYSGDRGALEAAGAAQGTTQRSGLSGFAVRWFRRFWGAPVVDGSTEPKIKVHVPLAADIARAAADLVFAEPPTITAITPDEPENPTAEYTLALTTADATAERIMSYVDDGLLSVFAGAAEVGSALGGVFLRATWDMETQRVFCTRVDADSAIPEFRWGRLHRATFWRLLPSKGNTVWRHLEIHEVAAGVGVIRHQLWEGDANDLGSPQPLADHPATEGLANLIDFEGDGISTRSPGLDVVYVPNITPNPLWRNNPAGANLGAPDIAGTEDLLDRLDHVYSALMREVDLAKARIVVPEYMLTDLGAGKGMGWDADREIWSPLPGMTNKPDMGQTVVLPQLFQPAIRVADHIAIMQQLVEDILRSAGYSAATFGEDETGAVTATEVNSKTNRSRLTRSRKIRNWEPAIREIVGKMLAIDVALGNWARDAGGQGWALPEVDPSLVRVEFPTPQQAPAELAQTVALLNQAQAISTWMKVRMAHPDWSDAEVDEEVTRIQADQALTDPATFGVGGDGLTPPDQPELTPEEVRSAADAMGVLIRAGVEPAVAAQRVGLAGLEFTGAVPTSLRLPEKDAAQLEQA